MRSFESLLLGRSSKDTENESDKDLLAANTQTNSAIAQSSIKENSVRNLPTSKSNHRIDFPNSFFRHSDGLLLENKETTHNQLNNDFLHASTIEMSIPKSSELIRDNSEQATIDPTSLFNKETDFIAMTSHKPFLESRSSLLENENIDDDEVLKKQFKAADIQEDWITSTAQSEFSTTLITDVKTNSPTFEQTVSTFPVTTPSPLTSTLTVTSMHDLDHSQSKIDNHEDNESESKSLLVELLPHMQNVDDEDEKVTSESTVIENKEISSSSKIIDNISSKKISNFDDKLDIIHKIEDIVLSELQPAKIRRKHLTPKEFECRRYVLCINF